MTENTVNSGNTANTRKTGRSGKSGESGNGIFWVILLASALLEAVWATALGLSNGFTQLMPTVVFAITAVLSMLGLGIAVKRIPLGTAYAVWVGIGAALTVGWAMITGVESASPLKLLFIAGIVGCAAGLKALPADKAAAKAE
ncbi:DMT family transporter [Paenarthrobacter sp. NPDC090517]|uniref:DMT family transporter n=1 Tax=Paenarthrobacter sp. NPDC090517 TaxID=3364381 RepID=UPI00382608B1